MPSLIDIIARNLPILAPRWPPTRSGASPRIRSGVPSEIKQATPKSIFLWPAFREGAFAAWTVGDFNNYCEQGFEFNTLIWAAIMYKVRAQMSARLRAYTGDVDSPKSLPARDPLAKLLARPNPHCSWDEYFGACTVFLNLTGNSYTHLLRPRGGGLPEAMYSYRPDRVWIVPEKGGIKGFYYVPEGRSAQDGIPILPEDMIHVKFPNPRDPLEGLGYGLSPLAPMAQSADVDNYVTRFLRMFFLNGAMTSGVIKFQQPITSAEADSVKARWKEKHGGYENWADIAVLDSAADYQRVGLTFDEMGFETIDRRNESRIVMVFGVPAILLGTLGGRERAIQSNYEEAKGQFWRDTMKPELMFWENEFKYYLQGDSGKFVKFDFSGVEELQADKPALINAMKILFDMGVPRDLAAAAVGLDLPPLIDDGVGYISPQLVPILEKPSLKKEIAKAEEGKQMAEAIAAGKGPDTEETPPAEEQTNTGAAEAEQQAGEVTQEKANPLGGEKGGPGSGNWGHAGIPGQRGGSAPAGIGSAGSSTESGVRGFDQSVVDALPDCTEPFQTWAVRGTDDWEADKARGFSFADWGLSPFDTVKEAEEQGYSNLVEVPELGGGYLPALAGLSSFADLNAAEAVGKYRRWSGSDAYKYMVVYRASHVGIGGDNEDLTVPRGDEIIFRNPEYSSTKGGPGSGNWGHAGITGQRGGSAPQSGEGAAMSLRTGATAEQRQREAREGGRAIEGYRSLVEAATLADERSRLYPLFSSQDDWEYDGPHGLAAPKTYAEYQTAAREFRQEAREKRLTAEAESDRIFALGGQQAADLSSIDREVNARWRQRDAYRRALIPGWQDEAQTPKSLPDPLLERKAMYWKRVDSIAQKWESPFREAATAQFYQDRNRLLAALQRTQRKSFEEKALVSWEFMDGQVDDIFKEAPDRWRAAFRPLFKGEIIEQGEHLTAQFGMRFDVQNIWASEHYLKYELVFAQDVVNTTKEEVSTLLGQARLDGWSVPKTQKQLGLLFQQLVAGDVDNADWYTERLPPHRLENIVRTETIRALNSGSQAIYDEFGAEGSEWISNMDPPRAREEHMQMHGKIVKLGQKFHVPNREGGYDEMEYPGDPSAPPSQICFCRCTTAPVLSAQDMKGGPGSGNWGHTGRLGERGGSISNRTAMTIERGSTAAARQETVSGRRSTLMPGEGTPVESPFGGNEPGPLGKPVTDCIRQNTTKGKLGKSVDSAIDSIESVHGVSDAMNNLSIEPSQGKRTWGDYTPVYNRIRVSTKIDSGDQEATFCHEFGHALYSREFHQSGPHEMNQEMEEVRNAIGKSEARGGLANIARTGTTSWKSSSGQSYTLRADRRYISYLINDTEQFARAYAQYVGLRSQNPRLRAITSRAHGAYPTQWNDKDFEPIAAALDKLFAKKGLRG